MKGMFVKDAEYQIEVALRLALVGKDRGPELKAVYSSYTKWMNRYDITGAEPVRVPRVEMGEWFLRITSVLHDVGVYIPSVRTGWGPRAAQLLQCHELIEKVDSADILEALCHLGNEKVMDGEYWGSWPVLAGVRLLLRRLWIDSWNLVALRVAEKHYWESDKPHGNWTESTRNGDFGYVDVLRAINNPEFSWVVPSDPKGTDALPNYIRYWFCLSAVLVGHLGWKYPAVGLAKWINKGMSEDNAILTQIRNLWGSYAASMMTEAGRNILRTIACQVLGINEATEGGAVCSNKGMPQANLLLRKSLDEKLAADRKWAAPIQGVDILHLSPHVIEVLGAVPVNVSMNADGGSILHTASDSDDVRASLVLENDQPWHSTLVRTGEGLPLRSDGRSWRVDVTSKDYGYIGEFRKSRVTGLWFAGKHSSHMLGNQD